MSNPVLAISWEILARIRWVVRLGALYFVIACVIVACLPDSARIPQVGGWLAAPLLLVAGGLFASVTYGDSGDLRSRRSSYPARLFTLPVSSFTLASVPFFLGVLVVSLLWVAVALALLRPSGTDVPLARPALAICATLAWCQAVTWTPFPIIWARAVLLVVGGYGLLVGPFILPKFGIEPVLINVLLVVILTLCYLTALVGVRLGRRGVGAGERVQLDRGEVSEAVPLLPFSSSLRAQLWLEWRYLGWVSLIQCAVLVLIALPIVHALDRQVWRQPFMLEAAGPVAVALGPAWNSLSALLLLPMAFTLIGGDVSRQSQRGMTGLSPFYATRASAVPELVLAKMVTLALFVAVLWTQLLVVSLAWGAASGALDEMMGRLTDFAGSPGAAVGVMLVGTVILTVVNWLWIIGGLWVGLSGRAWVSATVMFSCIGVPVVPVLVIKNWQPSWYPVLAGLIVAGLVLKVVAVAWVCRRLSAWRYADVRVLTTVVTGWLVVVGGLAGLAAWLFPGGWLTAASVLLVMPLTMTLAAPLALAWDRHR